MHIHPPFLDRTGRQLPRRRGVIVGIAGTIAAGKSTVSRFLSGLGAYELDVDELGHRLLREPGIAQELTECFGREILDSTGAPDRHKLGAIAFESPRSISKLNDILHPAMTEEIINEIASARAEGVMLVINAALLFETGMDEYCDFIITVIADFDIRRFRAVTKRGWQLGEMKKRERYQTPIEEKISKSDFVIENNGSYEQLQSKVEKVYKEILNGKNPKNTS